MLVEYGVLMNIGALSLMSETRTMIGVIFFLPVCLMVQLSCKNKYLITVSVFIYSWSDLSLMGVLS